MNDLLVRVRGPLVNYVRNENGAPLATVVSVGKNYPVGVAYCNPKDNSNKLVGTRVAEGRAYKGIGPEHVSCPKRWVKIVKDGNTEYRLLADLVSEAIARMEDRAGRYWK